MCVRVGMWKPEAVAGSLPLSLSVLFLCVHRMHVHSHVCWCTWLSTWLVKARGGQRLMQGVFFHPSLPHVSRLSHSIWILSFQPSFVAHGFRELLVSACAPALGFQVSTAALSFYVVARDPNSGLHGCAAAPSLQRSGPFLAVSVSPRKG